MIFIILRQRCRLAAQAIAFKEQHGTTGKTIRGNKMNQSLTEYKKNLEWGLQESVNGCIFQSSPIALTHIYIYIYGSKACLQGRLGANQKEQCSTSVSRREKATLRAVSSGLGMV